MQQQLFIYNFIYGLYLFYYYFIKLPTFMNENENNCGGGDCSICLETFDGKQDIVKTFECNHHFHLNCLNQWVKKSPTCPNCRKDLQVIKVNSLTTN